MDICRALKATIRGRVLTEEPLAGHTTWCIGGPADYFVEPVDTQDVLFISRLAAENGIPLNVIGNGSNILVSDDGVRGILVKLGQPMSDIRIDGDKVLVQGGARVLQVVKKAASAELGGLEFLAGIPASAGGAVVMNAGANGVSLGDCVAQVALVRREGELFERPGKDLGFQYRWCDLQQGNEIITEVVFNCQPKNKLAIEADVRCFQVKRRMTQPIDFPSAGCVFKNPTGDSAGRLIEAAGGKGLRVGQAEVSHRHANFILNLGRATAQDVLSLIQVVRQRVYDKLGVQLELEINLMGDFRRFIGKEELIADCHAELL